MDFSYNVIMPYLYIGSKEALDINAEYFPVDTGSFYFIVNCTVNIPFPKYPTEEKLRIPVEDDERDNAKMLEMMLYTNVFEKIYICIHNKQNVLIYSEYGQQRACALAACFLIRYLHMNPNRAVRFIMEKRINAFKDKNRFINTIDYYYYYYLQFEKGNKTQNQNQNQIQKQNQKIDKTKTERLIPRKQPI